MRAPLKIQILVPANLKVTLHSNFVVSKLVKLLMRLLAIRLTRQKTPGKSLVIAIPLSRQKTATKWLVMLRCSKIYLLTYQPYAALRKFFSSGQPKGYPTLKLRFPALHLGEL